MQDRVGQQFGNYRLTKCIGRGGFAEVYLAEHILLSNVQRAVKIMTGTSLSKEKQEEFKYEASILANLQKRNEHIVEIFDFGVQFNGGYEEEGIPYLVMEYAPGGTLRNLYPHGTQVPLDRIVFYTKQVAEALQCAHDQSLPIVHRDVKPENMLLRDRSHILLSDFGIAITGQTGPLTIAREPGIFGTAAYIAPEQLSGHTHRASDQYSLGIVVYEWLCGSRPFTGTNQEICAGQLTMEPPRLYPTYRHVTREIEAVVMRALKKKTEDRYPKVQVFAQALEDAVEASQRQSQFVRQPAKTTSKQEAFQTPALPEPTSDMQMQVPSSPDASSAPSMKLPARLRKPFEVQSQVSAAREELPAMRKELPEAQRQAPPIREELPDVQLQLPVMRKESPDTQLQLPPNMPEPAIYQAGRADRATWLYDNLDDARPMASRQLISFRVSSPMPTLTQQLKSTFSVFALSPKFASDAQNFWFRNIGRGLNGIAAIALGLLLHNFVIGLVGLLFSCLMFELCIRMVVPLLAMMAGTLVALYWGVVGWAIVTSPLLNISGLNPFLPGACFFIVSFFIHLRYVITRSS